MDAIKSSFTKQNRDFCSVQKLHSTEMVVIDEQKQRYEYVFSIFHLIDFPQFAHSSEQELKSRKKSFNATRCYFLGLKNKISWMTEKNHEFILRKQLDKNRIFVNSSIFAQSLKK